MAATVLTGRSGPDMQGGGEVEVRDETVRSVSGGTSDRWMTRREDQKQILSLRPLALHPAVHYVKLRMLRNGACPSPRGPPAAHEFVARLASSLH
jgi:hypothetical protein